MKTLKLLSFLMLLLALALPIQSQENAVVPQRTPEQEAARQTEKLQQELNLTDEQAKQVYEINLRYARERKVSNTRSQAVERMKNKNVEIERVLNTEQNERLQTKRYERTTSESPSVNRNQPNLSSGFRAPTEYRSNQSVRVPSSNMNMRSSYRESSRPVRTDAQVPQVVRRSATTKSRSVPSVAPTERNPQSQNAPSSRSSSSTTTRRGESTSSGRR